VGYVDRDTIDNAPVVAITVRYADYYVPHLVILLMIGPAETLLSENSRGLAREFPSSN